MEVGADAGSVKPYSKKCGISNLSDHSSPMSSDQAPIANHSLSINNDVSLPSLLKFHHRKDFSKSGERDIVMP